MSMSKQTQEKHLESFGHVHYDIKRTKPVI